MSLANVIAQLESNKYQSLSRGFEQVTDVVLSSIQTKAEKQQAALAAEKTTLEMRKLRAEGTAKELENSIAQEEIMRQADIKSIASDEKMSLFQKAERLSAKGYTDEARKMLDTQNLTDAAYNQKQLNALKLSRETSGFIADLGARLAAAPAGQEMDVINYVAAEFKSTTGVELREYLPKDVHDPKSYKAAAEFMMNSSMSVDKLAEQKTKQMQLASGDAVIALAVAEKQYRDQGQDDLADMAKARRMQEMQVVRQAESVERLTKIQKELGIGKELTNELILSVQEKFGLPEGEVPPGIEVAEQEYRGLLERMPSAQAKAFILNKYYIADEKPDSLGFAGRAWNFIVPAEYEITMPVMKVRPEFESPTTMGGEQETLQSLEAKLKKYQ